MPDRIRLIRSATLQLELAGRRLLVDPMLGPAGVRPAIEGTPRPRRNPLVELPEPAEAVVDWAQAVLVTHLHADHLDPEAVALIGDRLPVFGQPEDVPVLLERGLAQAVAVDPGAAWEDVTLHRTRGHHGTGALGERLGPVSGFVVEAGGRRVYVAGDTIWCDEVAEALERFTPDAVVVNAGGARFLEGDPIIMTPDDVLAVRAAAPDALLVAVHLEALNHCLVSRAELAEAVAGADVAIPADGESVPL